MEGYLAYDDAVSGKAPGILVVHEWWGLNDYARSRALKLAGMGYVAFAVDMYGKGKSTHQHPDQTAAWMKEVNSNMGSQCAGSTIFSCPAYRPATASSTQFSIFPLIKK